MIVFSQLGNLGRLGNQLFQIAATISHAKDMKTEAIFNKWEYNSFMLNPVNDTFTDENGCFINNVEHEIYTSGSKYRPIDENGNLILIGFFQSQKYFFKNEQLIRRTFMPKNNFLQVVKSAGSEFLNQNNLTAIHIRRGDYLTNPMYAVLDMEYYKNCVRVLSETLGTGKINIVVFSDDIAWCKNNMQDFNCENIYFSEGNNNIVDLYLMAHCKHHIIANSTFSWWGAWLKRLFNDNRGQTYMPFPDWRT